MTKAEQIESLKRRIKFMERNHKATGTLVGRLADLKLQQLNEENDMTDAVTVERKVHEIQCAVDDLTSLAHRPGGARALALADIEGIERRLRFLRFDLQANQQAAE